MRNKHIYTIDGLIIVGTLIGLILMGGYVRPLVIRPIDDLTTTNGSVLFLIENSNKILIDDNIDFTSPEEIDIADKLVINLKPGVYYWKAVGVLDTAPKKLTIQSEVDLMLNKLLDGYEVVNAGNTELNVEVYNGTSLIGNLKVGVGESENANGTKFIGKQDE